MANRSSQIDNAVRPDTVGNVSTGEAEEGKDRGSASSADNPEVVGSTPSKRKKSKRQKSVLENVISDQAEVEPKTALEELGSSELGAARYEVECEKRKEDQMENDDPTSSHDNLGEQAAVDEKEPVQPILHDDFELEDIKAKTMHEMVEYVGEDRKLLFITCRQAHVLATCPGGIQRLLDELRIPKPKLVINLMNSPGGPKYLETKGFQYSFKDGKAGALDADNRLAEFMEQVIMPLAIDTQAVIFCNPLAGNCMLSDALRRTIAIHRSRWSGSPPFTLVGMTHNMHLLVAMQQEKPKVGKANDSEKKKRQKANDSEWEKIMRQSKLWKKRQKIIDEVYRRSEKNQDSKAEHYDLDPKMSVYIICDGIQETASSCGTTTERKGRVREPLLQLSGCLLKHYAESLPCIGLKTGFTSIEAGTSGLMAMVDFLQSAPLLMLDLREIPSKTQSDASASGENASLAMPTRKSALSSVLSAAKKKHDSTAVQGSKFKAVVRQVIQKSRLAAVKNEYADLYDKLSSERKELVRPDEIDALNASAMARFHNAFTDDTSAIKTRYQGLEHRIPLHEAIDRKKPPLGSRGLTENFESGVPTTRPTCKKKEMSKFTKWFAELRYKTLWRCLKEKKKEELRKKKSTGCPIEKTSQDDKGSMNDVSPDSQTHDESISKVTVRAATDDEYADCYAAEISEETFLMTSVLMHENLYTINTSEIETAAPMVRDLVRVDRLPQEEELAGLIVLRHAWDEFDSKTQLATFYKRLAKFLFCMLLVFGTSIVACTVLLLQKGVHRAFDEVAAWLDTSLLSVLVFCLTLISSLIVSAISIVNPGQRWRRLRGCSCSLQSHIYLYRTRVGDYAISARDKTAALVAFRKFLTDWRQEVASGTDLSLTAMEKRITSKRSRHFQYDGRPEKDEDFTDDFHSPLRPDVFIEGRLRPMLIHYQQKLPGYARYRLFYQVALVLCTSTSALLAYLKLEAAVGIITSIAAGIGSWVEFSDYGKKLERCTAAIVTLKNILAWWDSLTEVEKSSLENIADLVKDTEKAVADEYTAWSATGMSRIVRQDTRETTAISMQIAQTNTTATL